MSLRNSLAGLVLLTATAPAWGQAGVGMLQPGNVVGNPLGIPAPPTAFPIFSTANSWTAIQSFIGNQTAPINNEAGARIVVQNSSMTEEDMFNGPLAHDVHRSTLYIPPGSTIPNADAYGAYIRNRSGTSNTTGNGVMFYGFATCGVSNTACWGFNPRLVDTEDNLGHGLTNVQLIGAELDYAIFNSSTVVEGVAMEYQSTVPFTGGGFQITNITPYPGLGILNNAYVSNDGAAVNGITLGTGGPIKTGPTGTAIANVSGQTIALNYTDANTAEHGLLLQALSTTSPTAAPGLLSLTDVSAANAMGNMNGLYFRMAAAGQSPIIGVRAIGATPDTNVNLTLSAVGLGNIILGAPSDTAAVEFGNPSMFAANGAVATVMTSVGPPGAHTTVQKWLVIKDNSGLTGYIPVY